jgi:rhomboid family GlyGly-CTERM serine protease
MKRLDSALILAGIATVLGAVVTFVPGLSELAMYRREAVLDGQVWRLIGAMWVHLSWTHWLANAMAATGLILLGAAATVSARRLGTVLLLSGLAVTIALLRVPEVTWYAGLSGALHGLALWLGITLATGAQSSEPSTHRFRWCGVVLCVAMLIKLWLEQSWLSPVAHDPQWGFGVARVAHALGAISGALLWCLEQWRMRRHQASATER